jgi:hypothetical protein
MVIRTATSSDVPAALTLWEVAENRRSATDTQDSLETLLARDPESLLLGTGESWNAE